MLWQIPDAALVGGGFTVDSRAAAILTNIPATIDALTTFGYYLPGDLGDAVYKKVGVQPVHAGKFQSADGAWWEIKTIVPNARQFGAKGDGVTDDWQAIQNAIDYVVYQNNPANNSYGKVHIPFGNYVLSDTLQTAYGTSFRQVILEGDGKKFIGENPFAGTALWPNFSNRPVIAVNGGRGNTVKRMSIFGLNKNWIYTKGCGALGAPLVNDLLPANWIDPALHANAGSRYAPYCAIAVDAYCGVAPATAYPAVPYPAWLGVVAQYGRVFTSNTTIEEVDIIGFAVGVANKPSNQASQADYTKLLNCNIEACQYGVSIGNDQSRLVIAENCLINRVYAAVVTGVHGTQNGKPSFVAINTEIGQCIKWMEIPTMGLGGGLSFIHCYGEVIYSLGDLNVGVASGLTPVLFEGCEFGFDPSSRGVPVNYFAYSGGGGVTFENCIFATAPEVNLYNVAVDSRLLHVINCYFGVGDQATLLSEKSVINATCGLVATPAGYNFATFTGRCRSSFNLNTGGAIGAVNFNQDCIKSNRPFCIPIHTKRVIIADPYQPDPGFNYNSGTGNYEKNLMAGIVSQIGREVIINTTGATLTYRLTQSGGDVGDLMFDSTTGVVFTVKARTGLTLTLVAQCGYNAAGNLLTAISLAAGQLWCLNCRKYTFTYVTWGDWLAANPTVTNCGRLDGFNGYLNNATDGSQVNDFVFVGNNTIYFENSETAAMITGYGAGSITFNGNSLLTRPASRITLLIRAAFANNT